MAGSLQGAEPDVATNVIREPQRGRVKLSRPPRQWRGEL